MKGVLGFFILFFSIFCQAESDFPASPDLLLKLENNICASPPVKLTQKTKTEASGDCAKCSASTKTSEIKKLRQASEALQRQTLKAEELKEDLEVFHLIEDSEKIETNLNDPESLKSAIAKTKRKLSRLEIEEGSSEQRKSFVEMASWVNTLGSNKRSAADEEKALGMIQDLDQVLENNLIKIDRALSLPEFAESSDERSVLEFRKKTELSIREQFLALKNGIQNEISTNPLSEMQKINLSNQLTNLSFKSSDVSEKTAEEKKLVLYQNAVPQALVESQKEGALEASHNRLAQMIQKKFYFNPEDPRNCGMTSAELAALRYYTAEGYKSMNKALRDPAKASKRVLTAVKILNRALLKLKAYNGTVMRGVTLPSGIAAKHTVGAIVKYDAYTSTSLTEAFNENDTLAIHSVHGRYIGPFSASPYENEVLFPPGARFKVLNVGERQDGGRYIVLQEIP